MHLSITPFIRTSKKLTVVHLRLIYNRVPKSISLGIRVTDAKNWDNEKKLLKKNEPLAASKNLLIATKVNQAEKRFYDIGIEGEDFSFTKIFAALKGNAIRDFKAYALEHLKNRPVSEARKRAIMIAVNWVHKYNPAVNLSDIDNKFLDGFKSYLRKQKLSGNTITGYFARIKALVTQAVKDKIIKENPFDTYGVGSYKPKQNYLTREDLNYIVGKLPELDKFKRNIVMQFCFCCYTGLRYSDLLQLNYTMLRNDAGRYYFDITQIKGEVDNIIPLSATALSFIDTGIRNGRVFQVHTNQYFNRSLKDGLKSIDFNRNVTCHVARHTFITIGIQSGMQREMVGRIAGHKKSSTTDGYTHLQLDDLFNELKKWNTSAPAGG